MLHLLTHTVVAFEKRSETIYFEQISDFFFFKFDKSSKDQVKQKYLSDIVLLFIT